MIGRRYPSGSLFLVAFALLYFAEVLIEAATRGCFP